MRSAHFTDTWLPRRDGVVTAVRTLTAALAAAGHPATTVVPWHRGQAGVPDLLRLPSLPCGVADLRMTPWPLLDRWAARALVRVEALEADVIHVHTPGPVGLLGVLAARRLGRPLVQTYHTDLHAYADAYRLPGTALRAGVRLYAHRLGLPRPTVTAPPAGPGRSGRRRAALDATNDLLLGPADMLVVPTRAALDRLRLPVTSDRTVVIPAGVAPRPATPAAVAAFRTAHGIAPHERIILYVGRVNAEKGIDTLLDAYAQLGRPGVRLVLVGAVYESRRLTSPGIVSTGQQPPEVVAAAYGAADVFAFPSLTDTQALVLQEAAHAGVPIVMADPSLHRHGPLAGAATLAAAPGSFADGLRAVLDDPASARALALTAAERSAAHTPERYVSAMLAAYDRVLSATSRSRARAATPAGAAILGPDTATPPATVGDRGR